jgi:hypothetical protein
MRKGLLIGVGAVATVAGVIWMLQGFGYIQGSFMTGATVWAVIGPVVALAGIAMITVGLRARRR